jgi:hypothetical protein
MIRRDSGGIAEERGNAALTAEDLSGGDLSDDVVTVGLAELFEFVAILGIGSAEFFNEERHGCLS